MSCNLKPGETCIYCGAVGKKPDPKPRCFVCEQPFTRKTPWRLYRRKRAHVACIPHLSLPES